MQLLLAHGADLHANDDEALRVASLGGHLDLVSELLSAGAHVDASAGEPLRHAARHGHVGVSRALLRAGADPNVGQGEPLRLAATHGHMQVVEMLLQEVRWRQALGWLVVGGWVDARVGGWWFFGWSILHHPLPRYAAHHPLATPCRSSPPRHAIPHHTPPLCHAMPHVSPLPCHACPSPPPLRARPPPSQGADVHAREDVALRAAVQRGQYEGAALLLQRYGADVHCRWGVGAEALSNG